MFPEREKTSPLLSKLDSDFSLVFVDDHATGQNAITQIVLVVFVVVETLGQVSDVSLIAPRLRQVLQQFLHEIVKLALKVLQDARIVVL